MDDLSPVPSLDTNAWRIFHDADRGVWIDHFDRRWVVQTQDDRFPEFVHDLGKSIADSIYWRPRETRASEGPVFQTGEKVSKRFLVEEHGVKCWIDFAAGYSPGIFLDQRENRERVARRVAAGDRVLNTFAYTGVFSVAAALAGAVTTTLDLSRTYLDWGWENFEANGIDRSLHFACRGNTFEWLRTFARQNRTFDGVILDPPTFSRDGRKTFRTDRDYSELVSLAARVLNSGGWLLACANTHRLTESEVAASVTAGLSASGRSGKLKRFPMPPEFRGDRYLKTIWVDVT
ncbi:MAG: class I SAM-dependent methyltransferase [Verrucomicrobiota bacterium]